jgi:hypothetical protein
MARVRVGDEDVHALFRPGGSVEPIDRTDRSGRTRFNLETGLQFANQAMRSPALGVGANLLARGISALGKSIREDGTTDMDALRRQAASRLAGGPASIPSAQSPAIAEALAGSRQETAQENAAANASAPLNGMKFGQGMTLGQAKPLSLSDVPTSNLATQNRYEYGTSPNMQYLPQGEEGFSPAFESAARAAQESGTQPPAPPIPGVDLHRPFISEDDIKRHNELRKHLANAASPAEAIRIAHEMQLHQDRMAGGRQNIISAAAQAAGDYAKSLTQPGAVAAAGAPQQPEQEAPQEQVVIARTPAGDVPAVRLPDRTVVIPDQQNGGMLQLEIGPNGRPVIKQRFTAEQMQQMQEAAMGRGAEEEPAETDPRILARQRAADLLRAGYKRPEVAPEAKPEAKDEFGRTPEQVALAKQRAQELVSAPAARRNLDRDQLLAMAAQARTPEQQAEVLRAVPDVDIWGTTLEDILTGSHQAKAEYLKQLHGVMPATRMGKTPEEIAHIVAQTETEGAKKKWYEAKPDNEASRIRIAENRAADAIERALATERTNEHRVVATEARTKSQENIAALKNNTALAKLSEMLYEFDKKLAAGAYKKGGVTINVGDRVKIANSLRDASEDAKKHIEKTKEDYKSTVKNYGGLARLSQQEFDNQYPDPGPKPELPTNADDLALMSDKDKQEIRAQQRDWAAVKKERRDALQHRSDAIAAQESLNDPELKELEKKADELAANPIAWLQSKLGGSAPKPQPKAKGGK